MNNTTKKLGESVPLDAAELAQLRELGVGHTDQFGFEWRIKPETVRRLLATLDACDAELAELRGEREWMNQAKSVYDYKGRAERAESELWAFTVRFAELRSLLPDDAIEDAKSTLEDEDAPDDYKLGAARLLAVLEETQ